MWAFRLLVSFLFGCLYASAAWSLTLPCEDCGWHVFPIVLLIVGSILMACAIGATFIGNLTNPAE